MDLELLQEMQVQGYVSVQQHPEAELYIYNYTPKTQYDRVWNEVTLQCRGLILNAAAEIAARPFPKFFNLGEMENQYIPNEPFEVYEKMDGSLGILYWLEDQAFIATRGSFASDQAIRATAMLRDKYEDALERLDRSRTYLFEIIYPENRIVVDYGDSEALVLLAVLDTQTGSDLPLENIGFPVVKRFDGIQDINQLKQLEEDNREGFVVKFQSGLRYKIKFEEYLRIHRIVTQVSSISIWEYLATGQPIEQILERVPDEFYQWVHLMKGSLQESYELIEKQCKQDFKVLPSRKETALYFMQCPYPTVLFAMLDNRPYDQLIWKRIRPDYSRPFQNRRMDDF